MSVTLEETIAHRQHNWLSTILNSQAVWVLCAIIAACIFLSFATDAFLTAKNLYNITRNVTFVAIVALGMTIVIITGGIDLSVGSVFALLGVLLSIFLTELGWSPVLAVLAIVGIGVALGALNGLLITRVGLQPFIVTLAGMFCKD